MRAKDTNPSHSPISMVAHELQAPLTFLRSRLGAALASPACEGDLRTLVQQCLEEIEGMSRMVLDLLLFGQADAGRLPREPGELDLSRVADEVARRFRHHGESKGLRMELSVKEPLPILGDEQQLMRVVSNLIDNAIKYTPGGGKLRVETARQGSAAELVVADTGPGIPKAHLPHLFEPFYQVDRKKSRDAGGVGLGLSIAKALAALNRGSLRVESVVRQGSRFILRIPLKPGS
ncbi:MAG: sensor histidine kinase [Acidobacteriota bacterium]